MAQLVKSLPAMQETWVDPWVGKISWRREWLPTVVFWPGELHEVAKSRTGLSDFHFTSNNYIITMYIVSFP